MIMKRGEIDERVGPGSVKAAIKFHGGDSIFKGNSLKKPQTHISEMADSKTRELHKAKRDIGRYKDIRAEAVSLKSEAENELRSAKNTARILSSLLRDTTQDLNERKLSSDEKELEKAKQELRLLRLEMSSVSEEKSRARRKIADSRTRMASLTSSLEEIKKEIEEVKDEQLVAELAHIEALRECGEIEAERAKEAIQFSRAIEQTRRKIEEVKDELDWSKDLEPRLAMALSDLEVLRKEMSEVREMDKRVKRGERSSDEELYSAERELASVKREGFELMSSMDVIRTKLIKAKSETARFEEAQKISDLMVQNLNSKLLRVRAKLDAVKSAEERANSILKNLETTLVNLKTETEAAWRDKALAEQEAEEIKRADSELDIGSNDEEEELERVMQELVEAKSREDSVLGELEARIGSAIEARSAALENKSSSKITISRFEYEYLAGRALGADDLADKKVAAAEAWVEAIKANEREIAMKIESVRREMKGMSFEEEREKFRMERTFSAKRNVEREIQSFGASLFTHRRSVRGKSSISIASNANSTPLRRAKLRGSASPGVRNSFHIKKKRQVLPNFSKLFKGKLDKSIAR